MRAATGLIGGGIQSEFGSLFGAGHSAKVDQNLENGVAGAFLNLGLSTVQEFRSGKSGPVNTPEIAYIKATPVNAARLF